MTVFVEPPTFTCFNNNIAEITFGLRILAAPPGNSDAEDYLITTADTIKRTITGTIVSWDEQGNTSVGPTVFAADSIEIKPVKLLLEHDRTRPIGKMVSHNVTANGIEATFKIANTMAGEDALVEATEGLIRALQAPQTDPTTVDMTLPRATVRANKTLAFDANGDPTTGEVIGDNRDNP